MFYHWSFVKNFTTTYTQDLHATVCKGTHIYAVDISNTKNNGSNWFFFQDSSHLVRKRAYRGRWWSYEQSWGFGCITGMRFAEVLQIAKYESKHTSARDASWLLEHRGGCFYDWPDATQDRSGRYLFHHRPFPKWRGSTCPGQDTEQSLNRGLCTDILPGTSKESWK